MSLADHYDSGSWLPEGWHAVSVKNYRTFQYNSGSDGVEFQLVDASGRTGKVGFNLLSQALWKLAGFAKACQLTREEATRYEPSSSNSHHVLVGRKLQVRLVKGEKYHDVVEWVTVDENITNTPADPRVDRSAEMADTPPRLGGLDAVDLPDSALKDVPF